MLRSRMMWFGALAGLILFGLVSTSSGDDKGEKATVPEDRRAVEIEFLVVDLTTDAATPDLTAAAVLESVKANKAVNVSRVKLHGMSGNSTDVQFGEQVAIAVGRTTMPARGPGGEGATQTSYQHVNHGTMVKVTPKFESNDVIALELTFERSRLAPTRATKAADSTTPEGKPATAAAFTPSTTEQLQVRTRIATKSGEPQLLASRSVVGSEGLTTALVVTARSR